MSSEELFLDTCIFFSYAYTFEDYSIYSEKIFNNRDYKRYTGHTVIEELDKRKERRDRAYPKFIANLGSGKNLNGLSEELGCYLSSNDLGHFRALRDQLISAGNAPKILAKFRRWKMISDQKLKSARIGLTGTIPRCSDIYMKDIIKSIIKNDSDSKIMMEVYDWSKITSSPKFITIDSTDIYKKSPDILKTLINYKNLDCAPFSIHHVIEFSGP